ncbi:potassium channel family protein [Glycomyces sp. L485]|uniref:potassium channel family protein n=1 Tax=Glycomyces sp. L485 TaxID=2909235 RepID=UPI001F4A3AD0|nr:potassium channel family protein [Glycomyces sp. L485]MCH7232266.1 potassium channel family protein [Glycomyces sp. L485]
MRRLPPTARHLIACCALGFAYAAAPVREEGEVALLVARWVITAAMLLTLALAIRWEALRQLREPDAPLGGLVVGIIAGVLVFALIDYSIATNRPDEFTGLETRVDALYFALTVLLTVGFGDITAQGQVARAVLSVQMVFNVVGLAGSASLLARRLADRASRSDHRRTPAPNDESQ